MNIPQDVIAREMGTDAHGKPVSIRVKYSVLRKKIVGHYDERVWFLTDSALAVHVSCLLSDIANPLALIFVDGPSTEKTTVLDFFDGLLMSLRLDKFTPASLLTQATNVKKKDLQKVDLLPQFAYRTVQVPEMGLTFSQPKEILLENYAILARALDGSGLANAGGVHGMRSLKGDYMFGFLGATTPIGQTAWNTMGKVGSRLIFLNAPSQRSRGQRLRRARDIMDSKLHYKTKKKICHDAVHEFLRFVFKQYEPLTYEIPDQVPEGLDSRESLLEHCGYLPRSVPWDRSLDNPDILDIMATLAEFLTRCRSDVKTWTERTEGGMSETNSTGVVEEGVDRYTAIIYNLARSHALVAGRQGVDWDDLPLVVAVTLSSLPDDRRKAVELLVDPTVTHKNSDVGQFTKTELMQSMSCSDKTAKLIMRKLELTGIGKVTKTTGPISDEFSLHDDYEWLRSEEFRRFYRQWDRDDRK